MSDYNPIITADQAADLFPKVGKRRSVSPASIREAISEKTLAGRKIGNFYFTTIDAVVDWVLNRKPGDGTEFRGSWGIAGGVIPLCGEGSGPASN